MAESTIKKYLDQAGLEALVGQIKSEDAKTLQAAKDFTTGRDNLFEKAGAGATAEANAKAYTDEKVAPLATKEALQAVEKKADDEVIRAKAEEERIVGLVNAVDGKADANADAIAAINNETTGILAKAKEFATTEDAKVQANIDALAGKVGAVPEGSTVMGIITNIQENAYDDTELRGLISGLDSAKADKTQVAKDIAAAVKVEEEARIAAVSGVQGAVDALSGTHATDKKALEDAIALKANQTALDEVAGVANAAVAKSVYDEKVAALEAEDARIAGLVTAEAERATGVEAGLAGRIETMEAFWEAAKADGDEGNVIDTLKEIQEYIAGDETGASEMLASIQKNAQDIKAHVETDHDFAGADEALESKLNAEIAKKADKTTVEGIDGRLVTAEGTLGTTVGKVSTLEGQMTAVQGAVATKVEQEAYNTKIAALEGADAGQVERIAALEAKFEDGEGSVESQIEAAVAGALETAAADATSKANTAEANAKAEAVRLDGLMDARMDVVEGKAHEHANKAELDKFVDGDKAKLDDAVAKAHVHTNADVINGITAEKVAAWDAAEANAKSHADGLNTAMTTKVDNLAGVVDTKAAQADLEELEETVGTNTANIATNAAAIAANASAIAAFSPIETTDIEKLFA